MNLFSPFLTPSPPSHHHILWLSPSLICRFISKHMRVFILCSEFEGHEFKSRNASMCWNDSSIASHAADGYGSCFHVTLASVLEGWLKVITCLFAFRNQSQQMLPCMVTLLKYQVFTAPLCNARWILDNHVHFFFLRTGATGFFFLLKWPGEGGGEKKETLLMMCWFECALRHNKQETKNQVCMRQFPVT